VLPTASDGAPAAAAFTGSFAPFIYWILTAILLRRH
jgi:hypothetical protein